MQLDDAYAYAARVMVENLLARDAEEGIGAFIDKRQPHMGRSLTPHPSINHESRQLSGRLYP